MLNHDDIITVLTNAVPRSNKSAVSKEPMKLAAEQSQALGSSKRNILRYVKIAIRSISSKLEVEKITLKDTQSTDNVKQWLYTDNHFNKLEKDIYKAVVRDGITYVLVAYDNDVPTLTQVDSYDGVCGVFTIKNPTLNTVLYRVNVWYAGKQQNVDIYYEDRIEKYYYDTYDSRWKPRYDYAGEPFPVEWKAKNGDALGIALLPFDIGESDIVEAIQLQSDLNESYLDLLATSRTMGWPQRVLKNASKETYLLNQYNEPVIYDNVSAPIPRELKLTPGSILMLQGADSDLIQLPTAEPNTTVLDKIEALISKFTDVPLYLFKDTSEVPSGVALFNLQIPLNHRIESHQSYLTPAMQHTVQMMVRVSNAFGTTTMDSESFIDVLWFTPEIEDEELRMQKAKSRVDNATAMFHAGFLSVEDALIYSFPDKTEDEIKAMVDRTHNGNQIAGIGPTAA